jgi:hypothetical protein
MAEIEADERLLILTKPSPPLNLNPGIRLYRPLGWYRSDEKGRIKIDPAFWLSKVLRVRLYEAASPGFRPRLLKY